MSNSPESKTLAQLEEEMRSPAFAEVWRKHNEEQTPAYGNTCKTSNCGGSVVREVTGMHRGHIFYGTPQCKKCHRVYIYAVEAPAIGAQEFIKSLKQPTTM
jgi:hypothetical protein